MSTLNRFKNVITSNFSAALDKAEDPQKILSALIHDMEDTLEQARLAIADALAEQKRLQRHKSRLSDEIPLWERRAKEAAEKNSDDLARQALKEKIQLQKQLDKVTQDNEHLEQRVQDAQADIKRLKERLSAARQKQKTVPPKVTAIQPASSKADRVLQQVDNRFEMLESRMERLEAKIESYEITDVPPVPETVEAAQFDPEVEAELESLKQKQ